MICPQFFFFFFILQHCCERKFKNQHLENSTFAFLRFFVCLGKYDLLLSQMDQLDIEIENLIIEIPTVINVAKENIYEARKKENYALIGSAIGIATGYLMQVGLF